MQRATRIHDILTQQIIPLELLIEDESKLHSVPKDAESHFKITIVADYFVNLTRIQRHRAINKLLAHELAQGLHALSLHLYTKAEWDQISATIPKSPPCRGGNKHADAVE